MAQGRSLREIGPHTRSSSSGKYFTCSFPRLRALTFHGRQPGQTSSSEIASRDLRKELLEAEHLAREKKRKAEGKTPLEDEAQKAIAAAPTEDGDANKRRKLLQEALELDRDDDDEESEDVKERESAKGEDADEDECVRVCEYIRSTDKHF